MLKTGEKGAVLQRDKKSYAIVPHIPLGIVTPEQLKKIAEVAEKYNLAALKLTSACRIAMVGFKEEDIDQAWKELGMDPGAAVGLCVRSIKACPGSTLCQFGKQDAIGLGMELDKRYHGRKLPNKFKIGVSGCINQCAETAVKDLGFVGKKNGWTVLVGGNAASKPRLADTVAKDLSTEEALELADRIIKFYEENAKKRERIGKMIERMGIDEFKKALGLE